MERSNHFVDLVHIEEKRMILFNYHEQQMEECKKRFSSLATELFFLQHGGNYADFSQFIKRPSQQLTEYLSLNSIHSKDTFTMVPVKPHSLNHSAIRNGMEAQELMYLPMPIESEVRFFYDFLLFQPCHFQQRGFFSCCLLHLYQGMSTFNKGVRRSNTILHQCT